ncbi:serine hydrolase domain-containing protein [Limosilactobacillus sp.]|uniref:serine hydrolase domain-containing protein n=1 Tax=Limosilactobacillus sp. TaxID=2773925 RepID=UPI003F101122
MIKAKWYRWVIVGLVTCWGLGITVPARAASQSTDNRLQRVLRKNNVNGVALVNGTASRPHVISHRQSSIHQPVVRADHLFPVASFQKLMTGIAVEQLIQAGQLQLTTPLSDFFPNIPLAGQVTVARMMMHTSGLVNQPRPLKRPLRGEQAQLQYALTGCRSTGQFTWHYTDLDFMLLAAVVQRVSHQSYRSYLTDHVLRPAGVSVRFYDQVRRQSMAAIVAGKSNWHRLQLAMSPELGAGDIFCTPRAYWQFYNRVLLDDPARLSQFIAHAGRPGTETYFGGTYIEPPYLHANGYLAGYSCTLYSNYQQKRTIMLFANNLSYSQLRALNSQLYHAYFGGYREEQGTINGDQ